MSQVSACVLTELVNSIEQLTQQDRWLTLRHLSEIKDKISQNFSSLPMPLARISLYENCAVQYHECLNWLNSGQECRKQINDHWCESVLVRYRFFQKVETSPLNYSQSLSVINGEDNVLVLAGLEVVKHQS